MIKCKICKFWDQHANEEDGFCRVLPPTINDVMLKAVWPVTLETDSCGAGKPK